ncbi:hypothetical protein [Robertmurraya siralis]|uniref:hypothetical protein n=1 Tax=Robertmurraya siralis TaxID=77777 RepID=UPI0010F7533D|nr:hypothetical protein [Robertmurraya siralis]
MLNYEAYDLIKGETICSTGNKSSLIIELKYYIEYQNHIDEYLISMEDIEELNEQALRKVGIKLYVCKW